MDDFIPIQSSLHVEISIISANIDNVIANRYNPYQVLSDHSNSPYNLYAVLWIDPRYKEKRSITSAIFAVTDGYNSTLDKFRIPLRSSSLDESILCMQIVRASILTADNDADLVIGFARLPLRFIGTRRIPKIGSIEIYNDIGGLKGNLGLEILVRDYAMQNYPPYNNNAGFSTTPADVRPSAPPESSRDNSPELLTTPDVRPSAPPESSRDNYISPSSSATDPASYEHLRPVQDAVPRQPHLNGHQRSLNQQQQPLEARQVNSITITLLLGIGMGIIFGLAIGIVASYVAERLEHGLEILFDHVEEMLKYVLGWSVLLFFLACYVLTCLFLGYKE